MTPADVNDWKDVIVYVICGVTGVVIAGLPLWLKVKKIDTQVSNSHDENLRDEITRGFREVREDIRLLSRALNTEREERIEGDKMREVA